MQQTSEPNHPDWAEHSLTSALGWLALGGVAYAVCFGKYTNLYIAPNMIWLVAGGGGIALLVGLFQLAANLLSRGSPPVHQPLIVRGLAILLLASPLIFYFAVTPRSFGADTIRTGGTISMIGVGQVDPQRAAEAQASKPPRQLSGLDGAPTVTPEPELGSNNAAGVWSPTLVQLSQALDQEADATLGKPLHVLGFVYREAGLPQGTFVLTRFATIHCAAEARPLGMLVAADEANHLNEGQWVWVEGVAGLTKIDGADQPQIVASKVRPTREPGDPYLMLSSGLAKQYQPQVVGR